jgi:quercetin 2,3-dioxygenase
MKPAAYRDIPSREIPTVALAGGGELRVIAGEFEQGGTTTAGPIGGLTTAPLYYDLRLPEGIEATIPTPVSHNTFLYVYEGDAVVGDEAKPLPFRAAGLLTPGGSVRIRAGGHGVRLLLLAGKPIGEPVVQYGPFVMNTAEEIQRALLDYQRGQLAVAN